MSLYCEKGRNDPLGLTEGNGMEWNLERPAKEKKMQIASGRRNDTT